MTIRILSYNILLGATRRLEPLSSIIASTHSDIIGLVEATDAHVVEELAKRLHMHFCFTGRGQRPRDWQVAVLSRYPILDAHVHTYPDILVRNHILEASIAVPTIGPLTVFVAHLTADFFHGNEGNRIRRLEMEKILCLMKAKRGTPHLLMGDFNTIAPGDKLQASYMLRHLLRENKKYYDKLKVQYPSYIHNQGKRALIRRIALRIIGTSLLSTPLSRKLLNTFSPLFAQGGIELLQRAGYVDCFRRVHPHSLGFTCPAAAPSGRIDYIFVSSELAPLLTDCDIVLSGNGVYAEQASDHIPVVADFAI